LEEGKEVVSLLLTVFADRMAWLMVVRTEHLYSVLGYSQAGELYVMPFSKKAWLSRTEEEEEQQTFQKWEEELGQREQVVSSKQEQRAGGFRALQI
jgi:hypothetical protein